MLKFIKNIRYVKSNVPKRAPIAGQPAPTPCNVPESAPHIEPKPQPEQKERGIRKEVNIPPESIIRTLCIHNKRHLQEIDRLQDENAALNNEIKTLKKQMEEQRKEMTKLENILRENENLFNERQLRKKVMKSVLRDSHVKTLTNQLEYINTYYEKARTNYEELLKKYIQLEIEHKGYSLYM